VRRVLLPAAVTLVLAGCASGQQPKGGTPGPPEAVGEPADRYLQITVDERGDGIGLETYTLVCDGRDDDAHPDPDAACAHLEELDDPFTPLPDDVACTEQFGGPQTARVTGRWDGEPVDLELSRTDGCRIAQWDGLGPLLPIPITVQPVG
jgi:uncharacterized protein YceK